jgi:hypothetical protein
MSDHYISLNRGQSGFASADFTIGTSSTPGADIKLRVADAANLTRKDVYNLVDQIRRYIQMNGLKTVLTNGVI